MAHTEHATVGLAGTPSCPVCCHQSQEQCYKESCPPCLDCWSRPPGCLCQICCLRLLLIAASLPTTARATHYVYSKEARFLCAQLLQQPYTNAMTSQPAPDRVASYGRGGAGNIGKDDPKTHTQADDLVTPTLKSEHYTTGRGGTGNIARNDPNHPEIARASQDVQAPAPREHEGPHHVGRGGAANVAKPTAEEAGAKKSEEAKGIVDKGKGLLQKIGGKKPTNGQPAT